MKRERVFFDFGFFSQLFFAPKKKKFFSSLLGPRTRHPYGPTPSRRRAFPSVRVTRAADSVLSLARKPWKEEKRKEKGNGGDRKVIAHVFSNAGFLFSGTCLAREAQEGRRRRNLFSPLQAPRGHLRLVPGERGRGHGAARDLRGREGRPCGEGKGGGGEGEAEAEEEGSASTSSSSSTLRLLLLTRSSPLAPPPPSLF